MKRTICTLVAIAALLLTGVSPGFASRGGHFGHGGHVSLGFYIGAPFWGPGWWGPAYTGYPYYPPRTVTIRQQPDTYSSQSVPADKPTYWYFCTEPEGYYPYVKHCPKGWLKVVPSTTPDDVRE